MVSGQNQIYLNLVYKNINLLTFFIFVSIRKKNVFYFFRSPKRKSCQNLWKCSKFSGFETENDRNIQKTHTKLKIRRKLCNGIEMFSKLYVFVRFWAFLSILRNVRHVSSGKLDVFLMKNNYFLCVFKKSNLCSVINL